MPIEFLCGDCNRLLRVPDGSEGKQCVCPGCGSTLDIPAPHAGNVSSQEKIEVGCPKCNHLLTCDAKLEGTRGLCPSCQTIFTISTSSLVLPIETAAASFAFACPNCKNLFEGKPEMEGRKGKCPNCAAVFVIEKSERTLPKPIPAPAPSPLSPRPAQKPQQRPVTQSPPTKPTSKPKPAYNPTSIQTNSAAGNQMPPQPAAASFGPDLQSLDLNSIDMGGGFGFPVTNDPLATSNPYSYANSGGVSRRSSQVPIGDVFNLTFKSLMPAALYLYVPYLCLLLPSIVGGFILALVGMLLRESGLADEVKITIILIVYALIMLAIAAASAYLTPAYFHISRQAVRGKEVSMDMVTEKGHLWPLFLLYGVVFGLIGTLVFLVCMIPAFIGAAMQSPFLFFLGYLFGLALASTLLLLLSLTPFALVDDYGFFDSLGISVKLITRNWLSFYLMMFLIFVLSVFGTLVTLGIGALFVMPLVLISLASFYHLTLRR